MPHRKHPGARSSFRLSRPAIVRLVPIGLAAAGLIWLCVAVGVANLAGAAQPRVALRYAPFDARANAKLAELELVDVARGRGTLAEANGIARAAVARDPTVVSAWRSLAMIMQLRRDQAGATRLFRFAERLSRRDLPTQLWLIEERVTANDIPGALAHYDIALRTSPASGQMLLPILASATSEDGVIEPLSRLLLTDPIWRNDFFSQFSRGVPDPDNLVSLVERIARRQPLTQPETLGPVVHRMVEDGQYEAAWRIARLLRRPARSDALLRNGAFEPVEYLTPFDWQLQSELDIGAETLLVEGAGPGPVLVAHAAAGNRGSVARQLLILPPGSYRISASAGPLPGSVPAKVYWNVSCARDPSALLTHAEPRNAGDPAALRADFRVPSRGCAAQWLVLGVQSEADTDGVAAWVDSVSLRPLGT